MVYLTNDKSQGLRALQLLRNLGIARHEGRMLPLNL